MAPRMAHKPSPLAGPLFEENGSAYTLATVYGEQDQTDRDPLVSPITPTYGSTILPPTRLSPRRVIFNATLKMAFVFIASTAALGATLWLALPHLNEVDRPMLRIPKSFEQLKELNTLLKKYRDFYPYRIVVCYVTTYLFLQAFSLPGSMYLSILGGAVWGVPRALPLACCCVATGASLCYLISAALGPALLMVPKWKALMDRWARKMEDNKENVISFLIVLRIAPLPPHWVINMICPHVGIGLVPFWISTFLGILGVTVIHTTIGEGLDEMTSADDFHLISWRNFFGLAAVVVGVMIPVGLRYWLKKEVEKIELEELEELDEREREESEDGGSESGDSDEDVILERGPAIPSK